jgi:hypothetical protein
VSPRHERSAQSSLCASIPERKIQGEGSAVARKTESEQLAVGRTNTASRDQLPGVEVILIAADAVALVEAGKRQVRLEAVVREPYAGLIICDGVVCRRNLRPALECFIESFRRVNLLNISFWFRLLGEVEVERREGRILIRTDGQAIA